MMKLGFLTNKTKRVVVRVVVRMILPVKYFEKWYKQI